MQTAKLFTNGSSQAVRLPKDFRFSGDEVSIKKVGNMVILYQEDSAWETFLDGVNSFTDDCFDAIQEARDNEIIVEREIL